MAIAQKLNTDKYGVLRVVQTYHEGPRPIHLLENGAYVFDSGLPVQDKADLRKGLPVHALQKALDWFDNKKEAEDNPPRAITVTRDNKVVFEDDGTEVQNIQDIVAYFDPGPFREAAMIAFAQKLEREKAGKSPLNLMPKQQPPKKKAPPKKAAGVKAAPPAPKPPAEAGASPG